MKESKSVRFLEAIEQISQQKGIEIEEIKESLEFVFTKMYKNKYDLEAELETIVDLEKGEIIMNNLKTVVDKIEDEYSEVLVTNPEVIKQKLKSGDTYKEPVDYSEFSRSVAQQIKQMLIQKTRESEKKIIYEKFASKKDELLSSKVYKVAEKYVIFDIDGTSLFMPQSEMNPLENYKKDDNLRVYIMSIDKVAKDAQIVVSRAHPNLVKRLMEEQIIDIQDGLVEIVSVAREVGFKTKVIVKSNRQEIDPVGSCIGIRGSRIKGVMDEIGLEKIDIIPYSEDLSQQIIASLSPAKVLGVILKEEKVELLEERWIHEEDGTIIKEKVVRSAIAIVPDDQNLVAIGKRGINVKLAVRLTKTKIDIKTETEAKELGLEYVENGNAIEKETIQTIDLDIKDDAELVSNFNDKNAMEEYEKYMKDDSEEFDNTSELEKPEDFGAEEEFDEESFKEYDDYE